MTLSKDDKEWIQLTARELVREVLGESLKQHILACPYGKVLLSSKSFVVGVLVGIALLSGGAGFAIAKVVGGL